MKYKQTNRQFGNNELAVLLRELTRVLRAGVDGDVVEFGCYEGSTSLEIMRVLVHYAPHTNLWLYDSFEGLPEKSAHDISPIGVDFTAGALLARKNAVVRRFKQANLPIPYVKKAWFSELSVHDVPKQVSVAFLDGDYYSSIYDSLRVVVPIMSRGGVIVIDDYTNPALPGVAKAVAEVMPVQQLNALRVEQSLAILQM